MSSSQETIEATREERESQADRPPVPGLVLVFSGGRPRLAALPLVKGAIEIGRGDVAGVDLDDRRLSRRHGRVAFDGRRWTVQDLGSRNGTAVDGVAVEGEHASERPRVVRMGDTLFLPLADARLFLAAGPPPADGPVVGPTLARAWQAIARIARYSETLHVTGESGAGKELAARAFHDAGPRRAGPFVAVNCAAIPEGVAERLLFGARKGAFSGATADAEGYIQAAHGGTLFLDEVAELDLAVQAKLLRVLESREVLALGASRAQPVDIRICSATHRALRVQVAAGKLREDLYFRLGRPEVAVPPLRERPEEIPWLVDRAVRHVEPAMTVHVSLVEAALLRHWPGNVRELLAEVRAATQDAIGDGRTAVESRHLKDSAGTHFTQDPVESPGASAGEKAAAKGATPDRDAIEEALRKAKGNVSGAARVLGAHRTQLRRWLERYSIDPRAFASGATPADDDEAET